MHAFHLFCARIPLARVLADQRHGKAFHLSTHQCSGGAVHDKRVMPDAVDQSIRSYVLLFPPCSARYDGSLTWPNQLG